MPVLHITSADCSRCGLCQTICPLRIITGPPTALPEYVPGGALRCIHCGHCQAICPSAAIDLQAEQLIEPPATSAALLPADALAGHFCQRRSIRHFAPKAPEQNVLEEILDAVRYAPSGTNRQPVHWLIIRDRAEIEKLTGHVVDWMRDAIRNGSPLQSLFNFDAMIRAWEKGRDPICRNAPTLVIAHSAGEATATTDALIALSWFDLLAPSYNIGTCWAGFFCFAVKEWPPLQAALTLPHGHSVGYALLAGHPVYRFARPPKRNAAPVTWR